MTLNFTGAGGPTMADLDEEFLKANGNGKGKRKSKTRSGEIIPVVRALLKKTVANGCTEAEARSAAAKAKELIDENNITDEEIHEDEAGDDNQQQQHQRHRKQADVPRVRTRGTVRNRLFADITARSSHVRFAPKSGHSSAH